MLLHVHPGNQLAFFEIAATLIPLLLFGGVVAERVGPSGNGPRRLMFFGWMVAAVGGYAIFAEAAAIGVVVSGEPTLLAEVLTMTFLIGGMIGVVVALVQPWYLKLHKAPETKQKARLLAMGTGVLLTVVAIAVGTGMLVSLHRAEQDQFSEARSAAITQKTTEESAIRSRILALLVAEARVEQQAAAAESRGESPGVIGSYKVETLVLEGRLTRERADDKDLMRAITALRQGEHESASG